MGQEATQEDYWPLKLRKMYSAGTINVTQRKQPVFPETGQKQSLIVNVIDVLFKTPVVIQSRLGNRISVVNEESYFYNYLLNPHKNRNIVAHYLCQNIIASVQFHNIKFYLVKF
jgi:hypothetical protein